MTKKRQRSLSEITFFTIASFLTLSLIFNFVFNDKSPQQGGVLGENDSMSEDDLNFDDGDLESSLSELDAFLDSELESDLDSIDIGDDSLDDTSELELEVENEIDNVEYDLEVSTSPQTTRKTTKLQKLLGVVPVQVETQETVTQSGIVIERKQTLLGKLLDLFSF